MNFTQFTQKGVKQTKDTLSRLIPLLEKEFKKLAGAISLEEIKLPCSDEVYHAVRRDIQERGAGVSNMMPFLTSPDEGLVQDSQDSMNVFNVNESAFSRYEQGVSQFFNGLRPSPQIGSLNHKPVDITMTCQLYGAYQRSQGIPTDINIMTRLAAGRIEGLFKHHGLPYSWIFESGARFQFDTCWSAMHVEQKGVIAGLLDAKLTFGYVGLDGQVVRNEIPVKEVKDFLTLLLTRVYITEWFLLGFQTFRQSIEPLVGYGNTTGPYQSNRSVIAFMSSSGHTRSPTNLMAFMEGSTITTSLKLPRFIDIALMGYINFDDISENCLGNYRDGAFHAMIATQLTKLQFAIMVAKLETAFLIVEGVNAEIENDNREAAAKTDAELPVPSEAVVQPRAMTRNTFEAKGEKPVPKTRAKRVTKPVIEAHKNVT